MSHEKLSDIRWILPDATPRYCRGCPSKSGIFMLTRFTCIDLRSMQVVNGLEGFDLVWGFFLAFLAMENARRHLVGASWLGESEHKDHKAHIKWPKRLKLFCQFSVGAATASTSNCWTASAKHVGLLAATAFGAHTQWPRIWRYEMREDKQHSAHRRTTCESEEMSESIAQLTATCNTFFEALLHLSRDWHWKWQPQIAGIFLHGYPGRESATTNFGSRFASSISDPEHCTTLHTSLKSLEHVN